MSFLEGEKLKSEARSLEETFFSYGWVLAEAEVPRALAQALRDGHMGVMDYYNMKNIQAESQMREQIAGGTARSTN